MVQYTKTDEGLYKCDRCGWEGSRSGFYKHRKIHLVQEQQEPTWIQEDPSETETETIEVDGSDSSWMDWGDLDSDDSATDFMPTPLKALQKKAVVSRRTKRTKKEIESARSTSKSIITLGLTFTDTLLSIWGRGQLLDPDFMVQHTEHDKEITSDAVVAAMEEKGYFVSDAISRTAVASVMIGWYVGAPVYRIQKKSRKSLFRGGRGSGILSRIPIIGRLFRRKKKKTGLTIQEVEAMDNEQ